MEDRKSHAPVLDLAPRKGWDLVRAALDDLKAGYRLLPLALTLGWLDIKLRYRGSVLGPFWLTISTAVMIGAMGLIYGYLFHMDLKHYLPFLSLSLVLWGYIGAVVNDGTTVFTQSTSLFHSMRIPATLPVIRVIVRNILTLLHNVVVIAVVFAIFHVWPRESWSLLVSLPLWLLDSFALIMMIGMLGARFRDISPIMASIMQIFFFVTPVIWQPDLIYAGRQYLLLDPFYPILEILRGPLLGHDVRTSIWLAAIGQSICLWGLMTVLFCRLRARIPYWI
ncbi:ABC transporter permease [Gluconobacter morbifer]|uniref:ABC transporter permease protein n=1 Tax=Gluconobacter morbifer G707 TaxID=1088869 RepID=G6XFJ8_9PROT|nr:ABC transporter permease [Gluconobacter morbifer]EHH68956.1 ABC transporter permease protein [Gluconobacter morbifer G707]